MNPQLIYDPTDERSVLLADHAEAAAKALGLTQVTRAPMIALICVRPLPTQPAPLGPSETGIDVSHWNNAGKVIDFAKVRAAGLRFVWIKRSQGLAFVDPLGAANFAAAKIPGDMLISNYHFFEWREDGALQADHFSRTVGEEVANFQELLDVELEGLDSAAPTRVNKTVAESNLRKALKRMEERFLRKPIIYTSPHYWRTMFDAARVADILLAYKFLIADWTPPLNLPPGLAWAHFHQKSKSHTIPGLAGTFDLDEYRGDPPAAPPPGAKHTMHGMTNQAVINHYSNVFSGLAELSRTGLLTPLAVARPALYTDPAIEDTPNLTDAEKAALIAAL